MAMSIMARALSVLAALLPVAAAAAPLFPANEAGGKTWVLLVAGSNSYGNYRHQSDVCHAYRLVTEKGGIPKENVVTFMFNDIAESPSNPVKGNIINHPNGTNNWCVCLLLELSANGIRTGVPALRVCVD
jgi:glycosylphosphatidylinositol transamidase (GPIT) subunit GPI8